MTYDQDRRKADPRSPCGGGGPGRFRSPQPLGLGPSSLAACSALPPLRNFRPGEPEPRLVGEIADRVLACQTHVDNLLKAANLALALLPSEISEQVKGIITPRSIACLAAVGMAWGGLHLVGIGEVADWAFAGYASFKGGYAFGSDLVQYVSSAWEARDQKNLRVAATYLARAVSTAGVNAIILLVVHKIGSDTRVETSLESKGFEENVNAHSVGNLERLKQDLVKEGGRRMSRPQVSDPELQEIVDRLYKPDSVIGTGSSSDALRREISTGKRTYDRAGTPRQHWYRVMVEVVPQLMKWIRNHVTADLHDRNVAWDLLADCLDAAKRRMPSRALIEDAVNQRLDELKLDELDRKP